VNGLGKEYRRKDGWRLGGKKEIEERRYERK
jgi:hypothetical protein